MSKWLIIYGCVLATIVGVCLGAATESRYHWYGNPDEAPTVTDSTSDDMLVRSTCGGRWYDFAVQMPAPGGGVTWQREDHGVQIERLGHKFTGRIERVFESAGASCESGVQFPVSVPNSAGLDAFISARSEDSIQVCFAKKEPR